jgi:hypothetical protein
MATAEKESLLKNMKIKITDPEEQNSSNSKKKFSILGLNEMKEEEKDSSKLSGEEEKEIIKLKLNIPNKEEPKNSNSSKNSQNSKVIKEKPEETENAKKESSHSHSNFNEESNSDINDEENKNNEEDNNNEEENSEKNKTSSFLDSKHYKNIKPEENEELEDSKEIEGNDALERKDPFMTTGKFMQIQPHFSLFSKRINTLREGIYDNTKKCLMYKSSLQQSENLMREMANSIVKDFVDKIYNLREKFLSANKDLAKINKECNRNINDLNNIQKKNQNEIKDCDYRINTCERQIGYKLLGKPTFSFMKKAYNTTTNK